MSYDLAILGAGPAGMSAALEAQKAGARVVVIDEQPAPGGQIYRNVGGVSEKLASILGPDYGRGAPLTARFTASDVVFLPGSTIWDVTPDGTVTFSRDGRAEQISARHLILATGAMERPVPLPGWTLPGVMTAGAAQIMMKSGGLVARDAVLVGSGPLLYQLAVQMIAAGTPPKALVETQSRADLWAARTHWTAALKGWRYLLKGAGLLTKIRRAGVQRFTKARNVSLEGQAQIEAVSFEAAGKYNQLETDIALLHCGVVPNTQISRLLRLDHRYDPVQRCFAPVSDDHFVSSNPRVSIAGDGARIGGADAAKLAGRIAALGALQKLGLLSIVERDHKVESIRRNLDRELSIRPFLDRAYPPSDQILNPADKTLICRCEEVTAGDIRHYAKLGCQGPNQAKAFGRVGMGPCQGRMCGATVTEIVAQETGQSQDATGTFRIRAPIKPVTLGELANLEED